MNLRATLRSLANRNFRLFFFGQSVSLIGTWMQQIAMQWQIFLLTEKQGQDHQSDAAFWLGMVGFASQIPAFFLAPVAGVLVDRWNRHRLIIVTQALAMIQAFVLAYLIYTGRINVAWIMVLSVLMGLINAFDMPGRQAFLLEMLDNKEDLSNAIALNSSMFNGARLVGPALAAALLTIISPAVCFFANGVSFLAVIAALLAMRVQPRPFPTVRQPLYHGLREGFSYTFGFAPIRSILLMVGLVSGAGMSYAVLLPIIATQDLGGEAGMFGMLTIAAGVSALDRGAHLPGGPHLGPRIGTLDHDRAGNRRAGVDRLLVLEDSIVVDGAAGRGRLFVHGADGGEQHRRADHCGRRQTRSRNELLHDGVHGLVAARQFAVRLSSGGVLRSGQRYSYRRCRLCGGVAPVLPVFPTTAGAYSPHLCPHGHPAGNGVRRLPGHRAAVAGTGRGTEKTAGGIKVAPRFCAQVFGPE